MKMKKMVKPKMALKKKETVDVLVGLVAVSEVPILN